MPAHDHGRNPDKTRLKTLAPGHRNGAPTAQESSLVANPPPFGDRPPLTHREVLNLQRLVGNQALGQILSARAAPTQQRLARYIQRVLARGSGWGWPGWTGGDAGRVLWEGLNTKFNTRLPQLRTDLGDLARANPFYANQLQVVITAITTLEGDQTINPIQYKDAAALDQRLDAVIADCATARTALAEAITNKQAKTRTRVNELLAAIAELDTYKLSQAVKRPDFDGRRTLKQELTEIISENRFFAEGEKLALEKRFNTIKASFDEAKRLTDIANAKKAKEELEAEELRKKAEAESERLRLLKEKVLPKCGKLYGTLMVKCNNDLDVLAPLIDHTKLGDEGTLSSCLDLTTPTELLALFNVHSSTIKNLNLLMTNLGKGRAAELKTMLAAIAADKDDILLDVVKASNGDEQKHLPALLGKADVDTLKTLIAQGNTATLTKLLVTNNLSIVKIKTLLATPSAADVVFLLDKVTDTDFMIALQAIAASPAELKALVTDLPNNQPSIAAIKQLLKRKDTVTTMAEIKGKDAVKKARGLLTNAGATIAETTVASLAGTGEKAAVKATLAGIAGGEFPDLTHPDGAKFGDAWNNDAGRLPGVINAGGYKEYYVEKDPASAEYHGQRRLVVNNTTGHVYYTANHYTSFARIQ